jgi:hypothetical protein
MDDFLTWKWSKQTLGIKGFYLVTVYMQKKNNEKAICHLEYKVK